MNESLTADPSWKSKVENIAGKISPIWIMSFGVLIGLLRAILSRAFSPDFYIVGLVVSVTLIALGFHRLYPKRYLVSAIAAIVLALAAVVAGDSLYAASPWHGFR